MRFRESRGAYQMFTSHGGTMPHRSPEFVPGNFYHVYNRGNNKDRIFFSERNYSFFLTRLSRSLRNVANVHAFCLMTNHYHLLLSLVGEGFSMRMKNFGISFAKAINNEQGRVGHLFQGRFRAKLVRDDANLMNLSRYIHLNPLMAGMCSGLLDWPYSSYPNYLGLPGRPEIKVHTEHTLSLLQDSVAYRQFVEVFAIERLKEMELRMWEE